MIKKFSVIRNRAEGIFSNLLLLFLFLLQRHRSLTIICLIFESLPEYVRHSFEFLLR